MDPREDVDMLQRRENRLNGYRPVQQIFRAERSRRQQPRQLHLFQKAEEKPKQQAEQEAAGRADKHHPDQPAPHRKLCGTFFEADQRLYRPRKIPRAVHGKGKCQRQAVEQQDIQHRKEQQDPAAPRAKSSPSAGAAPNRSLQPLSPFVKKRHCSKQHDGKETIVRRFKSQPLLPGAVISQLHPGSDERLEILRSLQDIPVDKTVFVPSEDRRILLPLRLRLHLFQIRGIVTDMHRLRVQPRRLGIRFPPGRFSRFRLRLQRCGKFFRCLSFRITKQRLIRLCPALPHVKAASGLFIQKQTEAKQRHRQKDQASPAVRQDPPKFIRHRLPPDNTDKRPPDRERAAPASSPAAAIRSVLPTYRFSAAVLSSAEGSDPQWLRYR